MIKFKIEIICNDKLGVQWTKNVSSIIKNTLVKDVFLRLCQNT